MPEIREMSVNPDNSSSRLSPIGHISFVDVRDTDAEIDYPLQGPIADGYFLDDTIWLDVKTSEAGQIIVSSGQFGFYGVGDSLDEAVYDATEMLLAHYEDLLDGEEDLPVYYSNRLHRLRAILITANA